MRRLGVTLLCLAALTGCGSDGYVIGRFRDDSCGTHRDALLCSGFELPDLSDWSELVVTNEAHVEQTDARTHDGHGALHAASTGAKSAAVVSGEFSPVRDGELFLRAYLYVPADLPTKTINFMFIGDVADPDPFKGVDFNLEDGALSTYVPADQPQRFTSDLLVIPRDRWFCLQIEMTVSPDAGAVRMLVDGEAGLDEHGMNTSPKAGNHVLHAGVDWSSEQTERFDVYMDDLVLATKSIACGTP
jgi:hypothetical protein